MPRPSKPNQPLPDGTQLTLSHTFHESQTIHEHLATVWELATRYERQMLVQFLEMIETLRRANDQGQVVFAPYGVGGGEV